MDQARQAYYRAQRGPGMRYYKQPEEDQAGPAECAHLLDEPGLFAKVKDMEREAMAAFRAGDMAKGNDLLEEVRRLRRGA